MSISNIRDKEDFHHLNTTSTQLKYTYELPLEFINRKKCSINFSKETDIIKIGPIPFDEECIGHFYVPIGSLRIKTNWANAIQYCKSIDFLLPNIKELDIIIKYKDMIDSIDPSINGKFSDIGQDWCWSSSESRSYGVWIQSPFDSKQIEDGKLYDYWAIPFKKVPL